MGGKKRSADTRHPVRHRPQDGCGGGAGTYDPTDSSKKEKKNAVRPERSEASFVVLFRNSQPVRFTAGWGYLSLDRDMASRVDRVVPAGQAVRTSMTRGSMMRYRRTSAVIAVLLGLALSGCQPDAGPLTVESSALAAPSPSTSEL